MNNLPQVSIITVVYNAESLVERTMQSVREQSWPNLQHIVVDGHSTDSTLEVVRKFERPALKVVSEKDRGIYDAMNKGLHLASGDYVLFLNAGDEFYASTSIEDALKVSENADFYFGNTAVVDVNGYVLGDRRLAPPKELTWKSFKMGMCVSHQSMIVRRALCEDYDLQYRISADIDWTIRVLKKAKKVVYTNTYVAKFLAGGVSSTRQKDGLKERYQILSKYYGAVPNFLSHAAIAMRFVWHKLTRKSMT